MPRRKKSTPQNERRRKVRRTDNNDEDTLVISDSENEEEEDKIINMTSRANRWLEREKRTEVHDMTEEEMLDLAMRLSEQEASSATQREKLEDAHMRKAIAESLNVSNVVTETNLDLSSSPVKPHEESDTVSVCSRRKLTFPSMGGKLSMCSGDAARVTNVECVQKVSPLPSIPDLSAKSSPSSSVLPSVPSAAVQDFQSSSPKDLNEQVLHEESPDDEPSQSTSQLQSTPALKQCSIRLCRDSPSTNRASRTPPCTEDSSLSLTCPGRSPSTQLQSPSPPQSPVFAKTDPKGITEAKCNLYTSYRRFTDNLCNPDETFQDSSSHKSLPDAHRDPPKHLSVSGKGQPSGSVSEPEDVGLKQNIKPEESKNEAQGTAQGSTSKSDLSLHTETNSMDEFTSHMDVHVSDDEDEDTIVAQSPVFTEECVSPASQRKPSPTQLYCPSSMTTHTTSQNTLDSFQHKLIPKLSSAAESEHPKVSRKSCVQEAATSDLSLPALEERGHSFISYYWGVPFCPKGQSPDEYTRVILTQLEVYEKSLKEAQRQLLHKAEWGLPLAPCPTERPIGKRLKRHRAPQLLVAEEEEEEEENEEQGEEEKKEPKVEEKKRESQAGTKERTENGQRETYVVVSSPEPLEEHENKSPLLFGQRESEVSAIPSSCRKALAQDMSDETQIQLFDEHKGEVQNGNLDLGTTSCPETQMTEDETPELSVTGSAKLESLEKTEVMEVDEAGHLLAEADEKMEQEQAEQEEQWMESVPPQSQADVECPICSRLFPHSKIEMHAADCNGTVEEHQQQENDSRGTPRRKRTRKSVTEEALPASDKRSKQQEKCYLCSKFIPGNEYTKHVDQCFQKKAMVDNQKGNGLLSALSQTEQGHLDDDDQAGPSNVATKNSCGLADPSVADESRESQASSYFISSSPIKSFTPISEVTDCLIDFSKQYPARANQRLGRKRKFKR